MKLTKIIHRYAREIGIELLGVAGAQPFSTTQQILQDRRRRGLYTSFAPADIERVCDPARVMPKSKSFIVVGLPYYQGDLSRPKGPRGYLARFSWGQDYHRVMGARLKLLQEFLQREVPGSQSLAFVDTGPFLDKEVAHRAGLGWFGKNTLLITKIGSWVLLGGILTTTELSPSVYEGGSCGDCELCLQACPTGALVAPGVLNPQRCLSYLSQKKGYFPLEMRSMLGLRLYGCDTCQEVCPHNRNVPVTRIGEFFPLGDEHRPELVRLLSQSNRDFNIIFGNNALGWRGRTLLQRNALIALGNLGEPDFIPILEVFFQDPRPLIRGHAAWALGRLKNRRVKWILERGASNEPDPFVRKEIRLALQDC